MPYTYVNKPVGTSYTNTNARGREQYDQATITYDDSSIFYGGADPNAWTDVNRAQYGSELITNGSFNGNASGWTLDAGWAYGNHHIIHTGTVGSEIALMNTTVPLVVSSTYYFGATVGGTSGNGNQIVFDFENASVSLQVGSLTVDSGAGAIELFLEVASLGGPPVNFRIISVTGSTPDDITVTGLTLKKLLFPVWTNVQKPT